MSCLDLCSASLAVAFGLCFGRDVYNNFDALFNSKKHPRLYPILALVILVGLILAMENTPIFG